MILAQNTFTIKRLAKDELNLVFSSDTVTIPVNNGVADLSIAEFGVKVLKGGRELFPEFDEEIDIPTDWTLAPEDTLSNAIITPHNCIAIVLDDKIKITSITPDKKVGYVDVAISYGEGNIALRRFTWATADSGVSITRVDVEFAVNTNKTTHPTSGWNTLAPTSLTATQQLWTRTVTYLSKGGPNISLPANITPQIGQGVESIVEEFAISDSKTAQPTRGWDIIPPTWTSGNYIWSRVKITYKNPTEIKYTGYAVSTEWEAVNVLETVVEAAFDVVNDSITAVAARATTLEDTTGKLTTRMSSAEQKITPDSIISTVTSSTKYTSNLGSKTYLAKPAEYRKGDRWVLIQDTQLLDNYYKKGQALEAVYATGNDSDWRLLVFADETDGINLIRNYTYKERTLIVEEETKITIPHWENAPKEAFVTLDDEIPTEFYNTSINVIGDEYGANYIITSEDDEAIQFDK